MPSFAAEERQLLHDSVNDFLGDTYTFEHFKALTRSEDPDGFDRKAWGEYANLGWLGIALPEEHGGAGGGQTELGILMAGVGRHLLLEPFLGTIVLGAGAILEAGTADQQAHLANIAAGTHLAGFCHAEPDGGFARDYVQAVATPHGGGYRLSGAKAFALHAHAAETLIVSARLGDTKGPLRLFLVPRSGDGVTLAPAPALDGRRGAAITLENTPAEKLGSGDDDQFAIVDRLIDRAVIAACAEACGAMAAVNDMTVAYLKTREQFGQPLSKFQVLQHRLVDMSIAAEEARAATHAALQALDDGAPQAQRAVWSAKVTTARAARFVGGQGIQLHGGMGMTDDLVIGHFYKRLSYCEAVFGDADWYLARLGDREAA